MAFEVFARQYYYPWGNLKIGESFIAKVKIESARSMASRAGRKYNLKFKIKVKGNTCVIIRVK